jgi:PAS domain-containing protein
MKRELSGTKTTKRARRNVGLRATEERLDQLRTIAAKRGISVQALFDEIGDLLIQECARTPDGSIQGRISLVQGDDAGWRRLFLKALPGVAAIKRADDLTLVWVNEGYESLTGESREALVGRTVGEIWATRESADEIQNHDREARDKDRATVEIETVNGKWGKQIRLRIRFPIHDQTGKVVYLGAIGFDYEQILSKIQAAPISSPSAASSQ